MRISKRVQRNRRIDLVSHEGPKLLLAIYDLAEAAGLTRNELTAILAEEVHRRIEYDVWSIERWGAK